MKRSAVIGGTIWVALAMAFLVGRTHLTIIELLFLLGPLVVVPIGLELCIRTTDNAQFNLLWTIARWVELPAALCAVLSFWFPAGISAAAFATPWFCFGCFAGIIAVKNFVWASDRPFPLVCMAVSFPYLAVGCAWLMASRLALTPMGFHEPIVLLTAVHFHFAGFAAPLLAMVVESATKNTSFFLRRLFMIVAAGVLCGPGLLAAGFVIGPRVKLGAALVVACSEAGLSLYFLAGIRHLHSRLAQALIAMSSASVLIAMVLAALWAIGEFPLQPFVHLNEMARFHGTANGLGFILCGLLGWTLAKREPLRRRAGGQ